MKIRILGCQVDQFWESPLAWDRNGKIDVVNNQRNFRTRSSVSNKY